MMFQEVNEIAIGLSDFSCEREPENGINDKIFCVEMVVKFVLDVSDLIGEMFRGECWDVVEVTEF